MSLPDKVTPAQTLQHNRHLHEQLGGQTFYQQGSELGYPPNCPTGPVRDTTKLTSHVEPEDEKPTADDAGSGLPGAVSPVESASRSHRQYEVAENYRPASTLAFGGTNVVREGAEQSVPTLGAALYPARRVYERADPALTTPTFWVENPAPDNVLAHAPKPYDRAKEEK